MKTVIGLGYKKGSGKDTVKDILVARLGEDYEVHHLAFAESLKEMVGTGFGLSHEQLYGDQREVLDPFWGMTPRTILQRFGTEAMRATFGPDIWVKMVLRRIAAIEAKTDRYCVFVITDVRFRNEAAAVQELGGIIWNVVRPSVLAAEAAAEAPPHVSEIDLDGFEGWDETIDNSGSLEDLDAAVAEILATSDFPSLE